MLGFKLLESLFEQENSRTIAQARLTGEQVRINKLNEKNKIEDEKRWREIEKRQIFEEKWGDDDFLPVLCVLVVTGLVILLVGLYTEIVNPKKPAVYNTNVVKPSVLTDPPVVYHYNMSREDWQEYQYQQSLKDIDAGVREQRMHNATLAAQRQAVVECRGGTEWLALPGAQFVDTRVPCTSNPDQKSKN